MSAVLTSATAPAASAPGLPWPVLRRRIGLAALATVALFALLGPMLVGGHPADQDLSASLVAPGTAYWLGTDVMGRSVLVRLAHATQLSLGLATLSALTAAIPGVLLGVLAAWRGGRTERALVLVADAAMAVPGLLMVVLFATLSPGTYWTLYVGIALGLWVEYFRVTRAASRPVLAGDAVQASRLLGFGPRYVITRHLLPALAPVLGTLVAFNASQAVLLLAALGSISVGLQPPTPELGLMMIEALPHYQEAPWLVAAPIAVLAIVVLGLMMLVGDRETT